MVHRAVAASLSAAVAAVKREQLPPMAICLADGVNLEAQRELTAALEEGLVGCIPTRNAAE